MLTGKWCCDDFILKIAGDSGGQYYKSGRASIAQRLYLCHEFFFKDLL
jgi:hypothetical protein